MLTLPGISVTAGEMVQALGEVAGEQVVARVKWQLDPRIQKIVSGWLPDFDARRARAMGFEPDGDLTEIIQAHIEDELGGKIA
jgi:nucleoside-diphosphate-sugar epimerase